MYSKILIVLETMSVTLNGSPVYLPYFFKNTSFHYKNYIPIFVLI